MRWKLLLIASLLAAIAGATLTLVIIRGILGDPSRLLSPEPSFMHLAALFFPVATTVVATIFIYRHTARRRLFQAILTIIVAGFLTLALLITGLRLFTKPDATSKSGNKSTLYSTERKLYQSIKGMKSALRFTTKL